MMAGQASSVTIFVLDVSKAMGAMRDVHLSYGASGSDDKQCFTKLSDLQNLIRYVRLKIQNMVYDGKKTEVCGIVTYGTETTKNALFNAFGGYEHVSVSAPIAPPSSRTLRNLDGLQPSELEVNGDPVDAIIVAIELQSEFLKKKKNWTRKIILVTNAQSKIYQHDWKSTVEKMNELKIELCVVSGLDNPDENAESTLLVDNNRFLQLFTERVHTSVFGNIDHALDDISFPQLKSYISTLKYSILRIGDIDKRPREAVEISIRTSKCTAVAHPKSFKKFAIPSSTLHMKETGEYKPNNTIIYAPLKSRTQYLIDSIGKHEEKTAESSRKCEKEDLKKGFKYGPSYVLCPNPEGHFPKLSKKVGIDLIEFVQMSELRRDYAMGETHYIWADPKDALSQCALSSVARVMSEDKILAVGRWVTGKGRDPKMGVMSPVLFEKVHCLLWTPMPFANDVRKYSFPSLNTLVNKNGDVVNTHPFLPTESQLYAMNKFVDAMDLMQVPDKRGRAEWFDTQDSYNPSLHRTKQAIFHCENVVDLDTDPLPPPHPELLKYFKPPEGLVKQAQPTVDECIQLFDIIDVESKKVRKTVRKTKEHSHALDNGDEMLLLEITPSSSYRPSRSTSFDRREPVALQRNKQNLTSNSILFESRRERKEDAMDVDDSPLC